MAIRSNLRVLHSQKEAAEGRRIPYREVSEETKLTKSVISRWMNNKIKLYYADTIETFCDYYKCLPGDILILIKGGNSEGVAKQKATLEN